MHTVVKLDDDTCKVTFVQKNYWTNIAYGLTAFEAITLCNYLNGGQNPGKDLIKKIGKRLTVTPTSVPDQPS